ncbi:MAG: hypothetical protein WA958_06050 [Tunicatimonas sp.]
MAIETKRRQILERVSDISDSELLDTIGSIIDNYQPTDTDLERLSKPMRETLDVEQLKIEQGYRGFNQSRTDRLIKEINLQEPLEELLAMI